MTCVGLGAGHTAPAWRAITQYPSWLILYMGSALRPSYLQAGPRARLRPAPQGGAHPVGSRASRGGASPSAGAAASSKKSLTRRVHPSSLSLVSHISYLSSARSPVSWTGTPPVSNNIYWPINRSVPFALLDACSLSAMLTYIDDDAIVVGCQQRRRASTRCVCRGTRARTCYASGCAWHWRGPEGLTKVLWLFERPAPARRVRV